MKFDKSNKRRNQPAAFSYLLLLCLVIFADPSGMAYCQVKIVIDPGGENLPLQDNVLGSNLPTWVNRFHSSDASFQQRVFQTGVHLVRIPGGSWSNGFDWEPCEKYDQCSFGATEGWIIRPTEFIDFLQITGQQAIYTLNPNGTSKEAAALVAFFNGSITDDRVIGIDVRGKDWGKVSDWAKLRSDNGNPDPFPIIWWEFGNEVYGGKQGTDCQSWGWEEVWTCDGTEYVHGIGSGTNRHEGYLEFRQAMRTVDPSIKLGAVGVAVQNGWSNWGNEVIAAAGDEMDFYIVHQYAYYNPPVSRVEALAEPQTTWPTLTANVKAGFEAYAGGRTVPLAITEYNMFTNADRDPGGWMLQAVNMLHIADTIGQMAKSGVAMANQWALANGLGNGTDYGLVNSDTFVPYPMYYAFPLWSRFGTTMLSFQSDTNYQSTLSLYAGQIDTKTISLMAINKTSSAIDASIEITGELVSKAVADQVTADNLSSTSVVYNGVMQPKIDFSDAPSLILGPSGGKLVHTFPKFSVTLLRLTLQGSIPPPPPPPPEGSGAANPGLLLLLQD